MSHTRALLGLVKASNSSKPAWVLQAKDELEKVLL